LEIRFNYALGLEKLSLLGLSVKAWKDYLDVDSSSPWAVEARDHLRELDKLHFAERWDQVRKRLESAAEEDREPLVQVAVRDFSQLVREFAEEDLLGRWGVRRLEGRLEEAQQALSLARHIGKELAANGEHMVEDAVTTIDQATAAGALQLAALAHSHALYQQALSDSTIQGCSGAVALFKEAGRGLEAGGSPFFRWAWLRSAVCEYRSFKYTSAHDALERMVKLPQSDRYPALTGNVEWILGLIDGLQGELAGALTHYRSSAEAFKRTGEEENRSSLLSLTAECLKSLGDSRFAWDHSWRSLHASPRILNVRKKYSVLAEASSQAQGLDLPEAALRIMDEAVLTISGPDIPGQVSALRLRAGLCIQVGRVQEARESILAAQKLLPRIADSYTRSALLGDLVAIEGEALAGINPEAAITRLSSAIDEYQSTSYVLQLGNLLLKRGQIEASLHHLDLAEEDLALAIQLVEEGRKKAPARDRESFLDERRGIYDEMAGVQLMLGRGVEALRYVEKARSRVLLESLAESGALPMKLASFDAVALLQRELPQNTMLIEYRLLAGSYYAWLVRRGSVEVLELGETPESIAEAVKSLYQVIERRGAPSDLEFREASATLFDKVTRPLLSKIGNTERLVIIPDGALYQVPFAALWNQNSRRFLVEDFAIVVAPSAGIHLIAARSQRTMAARRPSRILAVGGALIDRHSWMNLPSLPHSGQEAENIASLYPHARSLVGVEATPEKFLKLAPDYEVLHLAAHALPNSGDSTLSLLVLSPVRSGDAGALYARDISRLRFRSTRLVVLAACGSLGSRIGKTEGISGLARHFLEAGVPSVFGTLWSVQDDGTEVLARQFHELVRKGVEPVVALRLSQLRAIRSRGTSGNGFSWAAFEAFGA
jgi:CHAT domain-containing protein